MPKVTILGAGIVGMSVASQLPTDCEITIVAEHLPGDEMKPMYTSQWAGAIWLGTHNSSPREQKMELAGLAGLWKIAEQYPESSARKISMTEIMDYGNKEDVWYQHHSPDFKFIPDEELPKGAKYGMTFTTVILSPMVFLPWLRSRLEERGVVFKRTYVKALSDLKVMGHDVLVNAAGIGNKTLEDVMENRLVYLRQQNIRIKKPGYNRVFLRRGEDWHYSTAFGRYDGTIYIGGIKSEGPDVEDWTVYDDQRMEIMHRAHLNHPDLFPSANPRDYDFEADHLGHYHYLLQKDGGVRVEQQVVRNQKVVHVYGMEAGGYVFSFGLGRAAANLVMDYIFETPVGEVAQEKLALPLRVGH